MLKEIYARIWWTIIKVIYGHTDDQLTCEKFEKIFYDQYFPKLIRLTTENEFLALR